MDSDSSCGFHTATDIGGDEGTSIVAVARGEVVHVGNLWVKGQGVGRGEHAIVIRHASNLYSTYSHNRKALTAPGQCVEAGQIIAEMGKEGFARQNSHLHFEMLYEEVPAPHGDSQLFFSKIWSVPFFR